MSATRDQRVDEALQQLVSRLLPQDPDEDEEVEDRRWDEAIRFARNQLDSEASPAVADDVKHAADLIRQTFIQQKRPEKATKFSNLYSRLLSQPVLGQKWAILHFLHQVSNAGHDDDFQRHLDEQAQKEQPTREVRSRTQETRSDGEENTSGERRDAEKAVRRSRLTSPESSEKGAQNGTTRTAKAAPSQSKDRIPQRSHESSDTGSKAAPQGPAGPGNPSEAALLRDIPFTLQGVSSTNLSFSETGTLKLPHGLPVPIVSLLHALAEPALLYKGLAEFVDSSDGGLVNQSFRAAIGVELRSYLGLVATLESQIRSSLAQLQETLPNQGLGKAGVTLKRCVVWTREATFGLRLMSVVVDESKGKKGGELISHIHAFSSSHGDPFVHTFAERLLQSVTIPFYDMLRHWIYDGELEDPFQEFLVCESSNAATADADRGSEAINVWDDKYLIKDSMIPSIMSQELAKKVYLIGKSLNFIRHSCGDSAWVENYSKQASRELKYGDTTSLEASIDEAYKQTMARLISLMEDKFKLSEHLSALKKYLLLGQGDFIALLMESLASNLERPANSQYRHTLTAQLEHAIRNSNAQFDSPEVLRRLDARMLELSHGEIGWDVFTLEYRLDPPLDVIVNPWASKQYLKVFNFLWRVKRVEFALGSTWRRCMTGARGVLGAVEDKFGKSWKSARGGMSEMIHFVCQLQYYILFEVIEAGWEGLQAAMRKPDATLDTLISAHTSYLLSITRKGLLSSGTSTTSNQPGSSISSGAQNIDFTSQLHELLKIMLAYKDAVETLYSLSVAEFTRRADRAAKIETRTAAGGWGVRERDDDSYSTASTKGRGTAKGRNRKSTLDSPITIKPLIPLPGDEGGTTGGETDEAGMLDSVNARLNELGQTFRSRVNVLLGDLAHQPDTDMRFLGVVMNFNDVYRPVRRRREVRREKDKDKERR